MADRKKSSALCVFEDHRFPEFFPLSLNKPIFMLHIGAGTLGSRLVEELERVQVRYLCREYLGPWLAEQVGDPSKEDASIVNEPHSEDTLFLNGRLLLYGEELRELIEGLEPDTIIHKGGSTVAAKMSGQKASEFHEFLSGPLSKESVDRVLQEIREAGGEIEHPERGTVEEEGDPRLEAITAWACERNAKLVETNVRLLSHYWQLIAENGPCIVDDFQKNPLRGAAPESELFKGVDIINMDDIVIGAEVEVRSGTVLDASEGPIIISDHVLIEPNAIIFGPCAIGDGSIVRGGAKVGHGTSLGAQCRIGGEVGESIVASYTNKQHEGFLGHSYVGSWVNIGAGSCNSDLKNNYGQIRAWSAGRIRQTGRRFLGAVIGDHSKIAINSRINTATVIGFNTNVMTSGFPPKFIPSFTWSIEPEFVEFELEAAIATAQIMMDRRSVPFTKSTQKLFEQLFRYCRSSQHVI